MIVADSSFLVSLFLPNDINHSEAKEIFTKTTDKIFISNIILYETLTVINYKGGNREKSDAYEKIRSNRSFVIGNLNNSELELILQKFVSAKNKLSYPDISVVYLTKKSKTNALSFDKDLIKAIKKD
ncbi:PIN domain-containing protein [Candidatus Micrarchaeota archaeon]|nr:PIN domain-containing protein [Candidatus Micrarchaeota archaeon]MBU1681392.1 PIN domain-containing protein [Candidatus Micrarchaeota archaeon]